MKNISLFYLLIFTVVSLVTYNAAAQDSPFEIKLESVDVDGLGGVQSFAFGQHDGKWLIIGGRTAGLHQRQPHSSFSASGNNTDLIVIDPESQKFWTSALSSLSTALQEQLSSTNMEFYQEGDVLYIVGGYGYSATAGDHITYASLVAVDVPDVIDAVVNSKPITSFFRSVSDQKMAVTGGRLHKVYDKYYLVGGQQFTGRYNPHGPDHGPGFTQVYTEEIRKFKISDNGTSLSIDHIAQVKDSDNLHRRDYNVFPQIMPNGEQGLTAFSGVFQKDVDLPFLDCVNIDTSGHEVANGFVQRYNHYHCAGVPLFSEKSDQMHTVFFGGMAQFYDSSGVLIEDKNVPFVESIARVTRNKSGQMSEHLLNTKMPALLGAGSEFIPIESMDQYDNGVVKYDDLADSSVIGYVYGGIESTRRNIFFINTGVQSDATNRIFRVSLVKKKSTTAISESDATTFNVLISPNPSKGRNHIQFTLNDLEHVKLEIYDLHGRFVEKVDLGICIAGTQKHLFRLSKTSSGQVYFLVFRAGDMQHIQKIIVE